MRNLKRALSLALASVMLLGMMVVGTSAAGYDDVDQEDNVEAIAVLQAVKVMNGYDDGLFHPEANVTRNQMAKIICALKGVNENDFAGLRPYTDVPDWAANAVAACTAYKVVNGRGNGIYDGDADVTAIEAAAMMLRTLGYTELPLGDGWDMYVAEYASRIRLFDNIDIGNNEYMNRNQIAQLTLNALQAGVVEPDTSTTITMPDGTTVANSRVNYVFQSSDRSYAYAIDKTERETSDLSGRKGSIIQLGEQLYNGKLTLDDDIDDFGRPARLWKYDGDEIGTYAKYELMRAEYTTEVTGRELYDRLGATLLRDYGLTVYIDGISDSAIDDAVFDDTALNRNNRAQVGDTGNGVLTQVFVDTKQEEITISIVNTYLARAAKDYDAKKESVELTVYGIRKDNNKNLIKSITSGDDTVPVTVSAEDFDVADVKKNDSFLVNVSDSEIQVLQPVSPLSAVEITSFQSRDPEKFASGNLTTGGVKYNFSSAAEYEKATLVAYTGASGNNVNLKDLDYDVYLDNYGYVIGVVEVDKPDNYVFITGVNSGEDNLASAELKANAIFLNGEMKTIDINRKDSSNFVNALDGTKAENATFNKWCTYTVSDDGVYALTLVAENAGAGKEGQSHVTNRTTVIDEKNLSISTWTTNAPGAPATPPLAYGNDESVYLSVEVDQIATDTNRTDVIINDVDSVTVGIGNIDIKPLDEEGAKAVADVKGIAPTRVSYGVYTLYGDDGYVIAMVIVGEDNGSNSDLVYVHNDSVAQEYLETDKNGKRTYRWTRTVIIDGEEATLEEVNANRISKLNQMDENNWYRVRRNGDNEVTAVLGSHDEGIDDDGTLKNSAKTSVNDWGFNATSTPIAYVTDYDNGTTTLVDAMNTAGVDTVLYHEEFTNSTPKAESYTLYMAQGVESGIRYTKDVKVVLDQKNDNKRETSFGSGETDLKNFLKDLHKNDKGEYDYEISAVIEGPSATSIIIKDLVEEDGGSGAGQGGGGKKSTGAKAAIVGADTLSASDSNIVIGYMTKEEKPTTEAQIQAIIEEWAALDKDNPYTVERDNDYTTAGKMRWVVKSKSMNVAVGAVVLDITTGIVPGMRVHFVNEDGDNTGKGWEILTNNKTGDATNKDSFTVNTTGDTTTSVWIRCHNTATAYYIAAREKSTDKWTWSAAVAGAASAPTAVTDAGVVTLTGHDWEVFLSSYTKRYKINDEDWKHTAETNLIDSSAGIYEDVAEFQGDYPGTVFTKDGTTYTALSGTVAVSDNDEFKTGFVTVAHEPDTNYSTTVKVGGTTVTDAVSSEFVVPINTTVEVTITDSSSTAATFRANDSARTEFSVPADGSATKTINSGTENITFGKLTKVAKETFTATPTKATTETTDAFKVAWEFSNDGGKTWTALDDTKDLYVAAASGSKEQVRAVVTMAKAYTDQGTTSGDTADELKGGAGAVMSINSNSGKITIKDALNAYLDKGGIPAGDDSSVSFTWKENGIAQANLTITLTGK